MDSYLLIFIGFPNFFRYFNFWDFPELIDQLLFLIVLLHNFIIVVLLRLDVSMVFFWIQILFFYWGWRINMWGGSLEATTVIFNGWFLFEIGILDGKVGSISEEAIELLFFMLDILKRCWGANRATKVTILLLLKLLIQDKWTIMLDLFLSLQLSIIHF